MDVGLLIITLIPMRTTLICDSPWELPRSRLEFFEAEAILPNPLIEPTPYQLNIGKDRTAVATVAWSCVRLSRQRGLAPGMACRQL
jgi:hypothetical protein